MNRQEIEEALRDAGVQVLDPFTGLDKQLDASDPVAILDLFEASARDAVSGREYGGQKVLVTFRNFHLPHYSIKVPLNTIVAAAMARLAAGLDENEGLQPVAYAYEYGFFMGAAIVKPGTHASVVRYQKMQTAIADIRANEGRNVYRHTEDQILDMMDVAWEQMTEAERKELDP